MKNAIRILAVLTLLITSNQNVYGHDNSQEIIKSCPEVTTVCPDLITSIQNASAGVTRTNNGWYARLGIGYADQIDSSDFVGFGETITFNSGTNLTISAGQSFNHWGVEGEVSYKQMDANLAGTKGMPGGMALEGDQTQQAVMVNGFWYPRPDLNVSPYLGVGLGFTTISWDNIRDAGGGSTTLDANDNVFTYQLILGGSFKINPQLYLEVDYRLFAPSDIEVSNNLGTVAKVDGQELHIFALAIKYRF